MKFYELLDDERERVIARIVEFYPELADNSEELKRFLSENDTFERESFWCRGEDLLIDVKWKGPDGRWT